MSVGTGNVRKGDRMKRILHGVLETFVVSCCLSTAGVNAMDGVALANRYYGEPIWQNRGVLLFNTATGDIDTLIPLTTNTSGPCFAPDGKRVAVMQGGAVKVMHNDGSNVETVCQLDAGGRPNCLSWTTTGHLYWSDNTDKIYRVDVTTKTKEIVYRLSDFTGELPTTIAYLKVSLDGARGGCMVHGSSEGSFGIDFTAMNIKTFGTGCQGTVSPDGTKQTRNRGGEMGYSFHQVAYIHDFATEAILDTMFAPGAEVGQTAPMPRFVFHRFSHSSNDHVVFTGEDLISNEGYVHCLSTNETVHLGVATVFDFWAGTLPPPPADGPRISLSPTNLSFTSTNGATPAAQTVTLSNTGIGDLAAVTLQSVPSWLAVTGNTGGNTQVLTNTVDPSGLAPGAYNATLTVSGGGATNSANYTVTFNVGVSVNAPSGLQASATPPSAVTLTWVDNADNETGFTIERKAGTGTWEVARTAAADAESCTDEGLAPGDYTYRVRAGNGADSSGYSNEATAVLTAVKSITITAPHTGDIWAPATVQHIQWTTQNVGNVVLYYTPDRGETEVMIGDSAVAPADPEYGNYPWVVPALQADSVQIFIHEYGNRLVSALSECFSVQSSQASPTRPGVLTTPAALRGPVVFSALGSALFTCDVTAGHDVEVLIYRLDGAVAGALRVARQAGMHTVRWDRGVRGATYVAKVVER